MTETPDVPPTPDDARPPAPPPPPPPPAPGPPAYPANVGQPPPPYGQSQWSSSAYAVPPKSGTNGFAIASLVFGIIGGCLLSVIFGFVALSQIKRSGQGGRGMAIAGIVLSGVWVTILVIALAVGGFEEADRDPSGKVTDPGSVNTTDLQVGDCTNGLKEDTTVVDIPAVPCSQPHEGEVYAVVQLEGDEFPGDDVLQERAQRRCINELRAYSPKTLKNPAYGIFWFQPTDFTWARGDRDLACLVSTDTKRAGSITD